MFHQYPIFNIFGVFNLEFFELCKFVLHILNFHKVFGVSASIGGVKSQNNFVSAELFGEQGPVP